jgi:outer membrane lipoprotein-sorting protein
MSVLTVAAATNSLLVGLILLMAPLGVELSPATEGQADEIVAKMKAAYAQVDGYQTETEVRVYREGRVAETQRFLYTFRKPDRIRLDFETPHSGMVLTYPGKDGKVLVKPGGWAGFLRFHFAPDSSVFKSSAGQRIDQTDLGLLIQNIARSLTDGRRGEIKITERDDQAVIEVLADDHFLTGAQTLYQFTIDETRWLPVAVRELTPAGTPKRDVTFGNLRLSSGTPDGPAPIIGGSPDDGRSKR